MNIQMRDVVGTFAENKDRARDLRIKEIIPALNRGDEIILDFTGVDAATQSFIHALISELLRQHGAQILDKMTFKNCNETVKKIIELVVEYMQEADR